MKTDTRKNVIYLVILGIGMGFLEAIVVLYLRTIYYPDGFGFPMRIISGNVYVAEMIRELCTIIILLSISLIAGKNRLQAFAYFLFSFAIWDIYYYIGLKVFLNWPPSLLTWDILFLIPIFWIGPVVAPLICSVTMIIFSWIVLFMQDKVTDFRVALKEWVLVYLGFFLIFITFIWDYTSILISNRLIREYFLWEKSNIFKEIISAYVPHHYNWALFIIGIVCIYFSIISILRKFLLVDKSIKEDNQ